MASPFRLKTTVTKTNAERVAAGEATLLSEQKFCDFCNQSGVRRTAIIDGRVSSRLGTSWANFCGIHWHANGIGRLGTGFGQRLIYVKPEAIDAFRKNGHS